MKTTRRFSSLQCIALAALSATAGACAFPNDGSTDDVQSFDAINDMPSPDGSAMDAANDSATDSALDGSDAAIGSDASDASDDSADGDASLDGSDAGDSAPIVMCDPDAGTSFQVCGSACVDTSRSAQHCGRCDNRCGLGTECVAGVCNQRCSAGTVRCGTECIDPQTNPQYCNADSTCTSFTRCIAGQSCVGGTCRTNCTAGSIFCGGRCVDPRTDPSFCGATGDCAGANAGTACGGAQVCSGGACLSVCPMGTIDCGGSCIDPLTNRNFCGASGTCGGANAGTACAMGQVCVNGRCATGGCATGTILCGLSCIDPSSNRQYCGARGDCAAANAGTACGTNEQCISGTCLYTPPPTSILGSAVDTDGITTPTAVQLQIAAPLAGTLYYTLDGSVPSPGSTNTVSSVGRVHTLRVLNTVNGCTSVRWYMDYGAPFGREVAPHSRTICANFNRAITTLPENNTVNPFETATLDEFQFVVGGTGVGPLAIVDRGASVTLSFRLRQFPPSAMSRQSLLFLEGPTRAQTFCHWVSNVRDERIVGGATTFTAPTTPGRYALRWNYANGSACAVPSPLDLRTIGVLIVR